MLSQVFLPYWQKFNQFPIYIKAISIIAGAWLIVVAWPLLIAAVFSLIVFSTIQSTQSRYALAVVMLVPALIMEGFWAGSLLNGSSENSDAVAKQPSKVALVDHNNQVQGSQSQKDDKVRVLQAVSGDTIDVDLQGQPIRVRLLGIDSPRPGEGANTPQCFGDESKQFLNSLLENRMIEVIEDAIAGDEDEEGNKLRYVRMSDGTKVNELMLEAGLAREDQTVDYEQKDIFIEIAESADQHNKGLWASCADDGQPKITPVPSTVATPTPTPVSQPEPTGVNPVSLDN